MEYGMIFCFFCNVLDCDKHQDQSNKTDDETDAWDNY